MSRVLCKVFVDKMPVLCMKSDNWPFRHFSFHSFTVKRAKC